MSDYGDRLRLALIKQHKFFFDYEKEELRSEYADYIACPVCGSKESVEVFEKDWFHFSKCSKCSMIYLNPRLNDEGTYMFYNGEWASIYNETKFNPNLAEINADDRANLSNFNAIDRLLGTKEGNVLDIGPGGRGTFLRGAKEKGYKAYGIEYNQDSVRRLRDIFGDTIYNADLIDVEFDANMFAAVHMRDVFEHVLNPKRLLLEINRILKMDGIVSIEVPNIEGLVYKLVKEKHVCIFGFGHVNYWSPKTLKKILNLTGFRVVDVRHKSLDFRIIALAAYFFGQLPFTSVKQRNLSFVRRAIIRLINKAVRLKPIKYFDNMLPQLANSMKRGSVINVIAKKEENNQ